MGKSGFYITTAIDYVNARPHLGHAVEKVGADCMARYKRLAGERVRFTIGTDEHSGNVAKQAAQEGLSPKEYCDRMVETFVQAWRALHISYDDFVRTTEERHHRSVARMMQALYDGGWIVKGDYEGWYCVSCESFYKETDLVAGNCPVHGTRPEWIKEENYFFTLSRFQERLLRHIRENPRFILPPARRNEMLALLEEGLRDVSASRASVEWGIPLPFDPSQVTYIWFDALTNYLTSCGYGEGDPELGGFWPADVHVIGKDITRWHCIVWPAMLMGAGVEPPRSVFAHGFLNVEGEKISKTRGNVIYPGDLVSRYGADAVRYYLLREVRFDQDGNFSHEGFVQRFNSDLANNLGNLLSRTVSMLFKYREGMVPRWRSGTAMDGGIPGMLPGVFKEYVAAMEEFRFADALAGVFSLLDRANRLVEETAPWKLAREKGREEDLDVVLYTLCDTLRAAAIMLLPHIPASAAKILVQLGMSSYLAQARLEDASRFGLCPEGASVTRGPALFPRVE